MRRSILSAIVTLVSLMAAFSFAEDREQIGEVFGEPVYRDQIGSSGEAVRNDLRRLFMGPVLDPDEEADEPKVAVLDRIEVREIVLRDTKDRPRATIGFDKQDVLRFSAAADNLQDRFLLSVFPDGRAALIFRDARGRNRIGLSIGEDGRPVMTLDDNATIILHDDRGRNRAVLRTAEDGSPQLSLYDDKMKATVIQPPSGQ